VTPTAFRAGRVVSWTTLLAACVLTSCASAPKTPDELRAPAIETSVSHYAGSPLSGVAPAGSAAKLDADAAHALAVRCDLVYVEREIDLPLPAITSRSRLVAGVRGSEPIRSTSQLATRARVAAGDAASELEVAVAAGRLGRTRVVAELEGALPPSTTAVFAAEAVDVVETPDLGLVRKQVHIEVARGSAEGEGGVWVALTVEDFAHETTDDDDAPAQPREVLRRESVVLADRPALDGAPLALVFPSAFRGSQGGGFAVRIAVRSAPGEGDALARHTQVVAQCVRDARGAEELSLQRGRRVALDETRGSELATAVENLATPANRRAALVFLGTATDAQLCGDFALCSDDATMAAFAGELDVRGAGTDLGFALERATFAFLAARKSAGPLPPELASLLARHAGELGRSASGVEDVLASAEDLADLRARIAEENRVFLDDSNVGSRVRAFDWLDARGLAPAAFDPLGPVAERRAALEAAEKTNGGGR
jgi:hypothetical protein